MSAPAVNFDTAGTSETVRKAVYRRLQALGGPFDADVNVVAGGSRGAEKNAMIGKVQAAHGRNAWVPPKDTIEAAKILVRRAAQAGEMAEAQLRRVGRLLIDGILENVANQTQANGKPFRALSEGYARYKQRKHGFTIPILRATGDLLGGLRAVVVRR